MKATGIVRRIDDLGRVVIPKEIRRTMRIREGDPLEIYTNSGGEVVFKKYSPVGEMSSFAEEYADALTQGTKLSIIICDRDRCVAASGISKREVLERRISSSLEEIIENRRSVRLDDGQKSEALEGISKKMCVAAPIISSGDLSGAVVLLENSECRSASDSDMAVAEVAARFLSNQME